MKCQELHFARRACLCHTVYVKNPCGLRVSFQEEILGQSSVLGRPLDRTEFVVFPLYIAGKAHEET